MKLLRRQFLHLAAGAVALPAVPRAAWSQTYPARPVRLVVGFPAGSSPDIVARVMGQWLSERLGQQFFIDNRPGAGSNLATEAVVRAAPDGYTLLEATSTNVWNMSLYDKLNFDFVRDIAPVASINLTPGVMEVNPSFPAKTVSEFIVYAKANPGKINIGTTDTGGSPKLFGELFKMMTGVNLIEVPYRATTGAITDLIGGRIQVMFNTIIVSMENMKAGRTRPLAVTTAMRLEMLPDISTVAEFVKGYEAVPWLGIGAPKNTPAEIIDKLNNEINAGLADPRVNARLAGLGAMVLSGSPADFARFIAKEIEKWDKVIRGANLKVE
jgi:tripartite-type tricarboxylate transporter receptor subunit TctC